MIKSFLYLLALACLFTHAVASQSVRGRPADTHHRDLNNNNTFNGGLWFQSKLFSSSASPSISPSTARPTNTTARSPTTVPSTEISVVLDGTGDNGDATSFPLFEQSVTMQGSGCHDVKWTVDREAMKITYYIESAEGADWVGFGISENGGMKGADIAMIRKIKSASTDSHSSPEFVVDDRVSLDYDMPKKDTLQNVELLHSEVRESDQRILAVIRRDLNTCDREDLLVEAHPQYLVCASGQTTSDGEMLYNDRETAKALVNLFTGETFVFEASPATGNGTRTIVISPTLTFRGELPATRPSPLDIHMPNISLPENVRTACAQVRLPFDFSYVRAEAVWDDGVTMDDGAVSPRLHHQYLYSCPDGSTEDFDCSDVSSCNLEMVVGRGTSITAPRGLNMNAKSGNYVLQVHYDKRDGSSISGDRSGIRFWAEPVSRPSPRRRMDTLRIASHLPSIRIPADSKQKDYSIQMIVPGDATREFVPLEGLQVVGAMPQMQERGLHSRLQLIRDGLHIRDIYKTLSYDVNLQVPIYKPWKLLPGDSLLLTCTYTPDTENDVLGGLSSEEEMCNALLMFTPPGASKATSSDIRVVGYPVEEGQPLKKSFLGPVPDGEEELYLDPSLATFSPRDEEEHFESIKNHRLNVCELAIRDQLYVPKYSFAEYNITAMLTMIIAFAFCSILSAKPVWKRISPMEVECDERKKRNTIVYIGQLVFGSIALPCMIVQFIQIYGASTSFDAMHTPAYVLTRGMVVVQVLLFLLELFYRIEVRMEVVLHHGIVAAVAIFIFWLISADLAGEYIFEISVVLFLQAVTDHPLNLTLLLKNLGYANTTWWPKLCKASGVIFILCKVIPAALAIPVMVNVINGNDASWLVTNKSFSEWLDTDDAIGMTAINIFIGVCISGLFLVQLYIAYVMWVLGTKYEEKKKNQARAQQGFHSESEKTGCSLSNHCVVESNLLI